MASKIIQALGRLVGLDTAGKDVPDELDTSTMGQVLAMLAGTVAGRRQLIGAGISGELLAAVPLADCRRITNFAVMTVGGVWTACGGGVPAAMDPNLLGIQFFAWGPCCFAPCIGIVPIAGYIMAGHVDAAPLNHSGQVCYPLHWTVWAAQAWPVGGVAVVQTEVAYFWRV